MSIILNMNDFRADLASPDLDGDDRERLLVSAMRRVLSASRLARVWKGDRAGAVLTLHSAGFTAAEVLELVDDAMQVEALPMPQGLAFGVAASVAVLGTLALCQDAMAQGMAEDRTLAAGLGGMAVGIALCIALLVVLRLVENRSRRREPEWDVAGSDDEATRRLR